MKNQTTMQNLLLFRKPNATNTLIHIKQYNNEKEKTNYKTIKKILTHIVIK